MKDFIKTIVAVWVGLLLFTVMGAGVTILVLFGLGSKIEETTQKLEDQTILVYDLSLWVTDRPQSSGTLSAALDETPTISLRSLLDTLEAAATDDQIAALYLTGEQGLAGSGYGNLKEIRQALVKFKESGKPILAYSVDWTKADYYLASVADTVVVNPVGSVAVDGLRSEVQFYGGALQKYGIGMQVVRVGKYKAAVEPYTEQKFSAANREQLQTLLGDLWQEYLTTVEEGRSVKVAQLKTLSQQQGILMPEEAQKQGLVDKIQHLDEVQTALRQLAGLEEETPSETQTSPSSSANPSPSANPSTNPSAAPTTSPSPTGESAANSDESSEAGTEAGTEIGTEIGTEVAPEDEIEETDLSIIDVVDYSRYIAKEAPSSESTNQVAIVYAEGTIISGEGDLGVIGSDEYVEVFQELRQNKDVKAVVLRINSPGGSATASHLIEREVELLQAEKPVIVSMGDVAASGGYMIAAPAQTIVAEPNTITGSIGVFGLLPNAQKLANNNGVTWDSIATGPYANLYTIARPRTPAEMALLQKFVDEFYTDFIDLVAKGRKLTPAAVNEVAQGRVWSGVAAQRVKLVDELGGLQTAIDRAIVAANLAEGDWYLAEYPALPTLEEEIIDRLFGGIELSFLPSQTTLTPPVQNLVQTMQDDWDTLLEFSDPRQIYMRLPYRLTVE